MPGIGIDTSSVEKAVGSMSSKAGSTLDKDAFLQLLVTQMQYQDPLEPTSNTEYMAQLAQFSTVEQLENLSGIFSANQALNMAGQYVILNVPDAAGNMNQVSGLVDFVTMKDGKAFFHINEDYYPAEYLDSIVSLDYLEHLINSANQADGKQEDGDAEDSGNTAGSGENTTA
ncbi:MAG: hypothetical protein NC300_01130 [Bacteroidales bacterium]|nr:hypothetical protein [Clostridium sp.]MCM1202727.1 hypothetical protein [Bacteroidales bacterium]